MKTKERVSILISVIVALSICINWDYLKKLISHLISNI